VRFDFHQLAFYNDLYYDSSAKYSFQGPAIDPDGWLNQNNANQANATQFGFPFVQPGTYNPTEGQGKCPKGLNYWQIKALLVYSNDEPENTFSDGSSQSSGSWRPRPQ